MAEIETTRLSTRGQVVLPKALRERLGLDAGDRLAVYGEGDTVILKRLDTPTLEELKALHERMTAFAEERGITREDVERAIAELRAERRDESA